MHKNFSQYELIIFPNTACMSIKEVEAIQQYVKNGGHIIVTYDTGFYDELGRPYDNEGIQEVLGIEEIKESEYMRCDHIEIESSIFTKNIHQKLIPAPNLHIKLKPKKSAYSYMYYRQKQNSTYCDLPKKTNNPFLMCNEYGSGKAFTITGNIDAMYETYRFPEYSTLLSNVVENLSTRQVQLDPRFTSLQVNIREKEERSVMHLINFTTYGGARPIKDIITLKEVEVAIALEKAPKEIKIQKTNQNLLFEYQEGFVKFIIPEVKEYEIIGIYYS